MLDSDPDMTSRLAYVRSQLPNLTSALGTFQSSSSSFRVLRTINAQASSNDPKTLFILDSSFNPPSRAHLALATSVLSEPRERNRRQRYLEPCRLLLLFSTQNADKAPSAATFEQRLAMMCVFAEDIVDTLRDHSHSNSATSDVASSTETSTLDADPQTAQHPSKIPIDIGVTTQPYYTDKSAAIESSSPAFYPLSPNRPHHVHLCGFDTLTRILNPKYYSSFSPPLSALAPYFAAGHGFRVMQRPDEEYGSVEQQEQLLQDLAGGAMKGAGAREEWAWQIEMVGGEEALGISSTRVRRAAKAGDGDEVRRLCTKGVANWVLEEAVYKDDDRGAKMA